MLFPSIITDSPITRIILDDATAGDDLPDVLAVVSCADPAAYHGLPRQTPRRTPLLAEHALGLYGRPLVAGAPRHIRRWRCGHRIGLVTPIHPGSRSDD